MKKLAFFWFLSLILLVGFFYVSYLKRGQDLEVHFIDSGYSDAILVKLPDHKTLMIDAGDLEHETRILKYLNHQDIKKIDYFFLSHPHKNHFGSLERIISTFPVSKIFTNGELQGEAGFQNVLRSIQFKQIPLQILRSGMFLNELGKDIQIDVLNPASLSSDQNASSLVLKIIYKNVSFLFMSDIPPITQEELIQIYGSKLKSGCILIPHHGGPISSRFASFFNPAIYIASTGPNRWNLPRQEELNQLKGEVYRTDINRTIVVSTEGQRFYVKTER